MAFFEKLRQSFLHFALRTVVQIYYMVIVMMQGSSLYYVFLGKVFAFQLFYLRYVNVALMDLSEELSLYAEVVLTY